MNTMIVDALEESRYVFFSLSALLCTVKGTNVETDMYVFLDYLVRSGYVKLYGKIYVLTKKGKNSGLFFDKPDDPRIFLSGKGYIHFLNELLDGRVC